MRSRYFPDKAIDILDQAVGRVVSRRESQKERRKITVEDVRNIVGSLTGLPVGKLEDELKSRLQGLSAFLKKRILGQDHVVDMVVDIIWPKTLGLDLRPEWRVFVRRTDGRGENRICALPD
jgi:ATP-dependent Clp protease ATP-binding subunit ClpA